MEPESNLKVVLNTPVAENPSIDSEWVMQGGKFPIDAHDRGKNDWGQDCDFVSLEGADIIRQPNGVERQRIPNRKPDESQIASLTASLRSP